MREQACPLLGIGSDTSPASVRGVEEGGLVVDEHGGSGTRYCKCLVCERAFAVTEDMGYHVPQYGWPGRCLKEIH